MVNNNGDVMISYEIVLSFVIYTVQFFSDRHDFSWHFLTVVTVGVVAVGYSLRSFKCCFCDRFLFLVSSIVTYISKSRFRSCCSWSEIYPMKVDHNG